MSHHATETETTNRETAMTAHAATTNDRILDAIIARATEQCPGPLPGAIGVAQSPELIRRLADGRFDAGHVAARLSGASAPQCNDIGVDTLREWLATNGHAANDATVGRCIANAIACRTNRRQTDREWANLWRDEFAALLD